MRRIVLWLMSTLTVLVLLFGYHTSTSSHGGQPSLAARASGGVISGGDSGNSDDSSPSAASSSAAPSSAAASSAAAAPATAAPGRAATSKTVTGTVADTQWGPVQVQLTVAAKKITDVSVVQYPNGNGRDQEINGQALPILIQETLDQQSSSIDMVSGATVTSDGYLQSLQSALDKAGL